jgi:hypothetical protein
MLTILSPIVSQTCFPSWVDYPDPSFGLPMGIRLAFGFGIGFARFGLTLIVFVAGAVREHSALVIETLDVVVFAS